MPTYEYRCDKCGKFEYDQKITEDPIKSCPTCKGAVKRLISAVGIAFKGSGFHITDYSSKKAPEAKPATACAKAESCPNATCAAKPTETKSS